MRLQKQVLQFFPFPPVPRFSPCEAVTLGAQEASRELYAGHLLTQADPAPAIPAPGPQGQQSEIRARHQPHALEQIGGDRWARCSCGARSFPYVYVVDAEKWRCPVLEGELEAARAAVIYARHVSVAQLAGVVR